METIALARVWQIGNPLASGGFGRIYEAKADDDSAAVLKLVPKTPGASRELLFEELSGLPNIIPILDRGEWKEYYVIVMPRAERSLRQHLEVAGGKLGLDETIAVLTDVAQALAALKAEVVHRDLKPENVLLYKEHWCLADFGIARYAEATTTPDTRKFAMTPRYAAPEQWRGERATYATDVYAFGVMAFELLQGRLPFPGPDFREQHLNQPPPAVSDCPPPLVSLVNECLFKAQAARPTPANILARLQASQRPASPAAGKLQAINRAIIEKKGEQQALASAQRSREEARSELAKSAWQSLSVLREALRTRILEAAPATVVSTTNALGCTFQLGEGTLTIDPLQLAPVGCLSAYDYAPPFDVIAYTAIAARKPRDRYDYEGRAHSLWYCDAHDEGVYRWYELAFMVQALLPERGILNPFAMPPTDKDAAGAFTPVLSARQIAWQPLPFDQGNDEQFIERWLNWFAAATSGSLGHLSQMPEQSGGKYRRARQRS
jgi:serine/threonine-protein kinase